MKLRTVRKTAAAVAGVLVLVASSGCSRDHIKAINLANRGDKSVKVNVESAISLYQQALQLDPTNHRILWKLAMAYEKKESWSKMASTLARATQVAPSFANYWANRGYALVREAEAGNKDAYGEAKAPLKKCIEKDPNYAECYHFLGEADLWTDDVQDALSNYTKAIEHNPQVAYFYPPLAETYITLKFYKQAGQVLKQGTSIIRPTKKNANNLYGMYVLRFDVAQSNDDKPEMLASMLDAQKFAGHSHPEIQFNLGSTYAEMDPPQKEKAVRMLSSFSKRACRSANAKKFREQCETSSALIQKLGGKVN